jgi:hypothetical protein
MTRALSALAALVLVGCSVALAQTGAPVTATVDPLASLVGGGAVGTLGTGAVAVWLGRLFERMMSLGERIEQKLDRICVAVDAIETDIEHPTEERRKRRPKAAAPA